MALVDSIDKIVFSYFAVIASESFMYKGKKYLPRPLRVSPGIFRGFTCPPNCGGCCPRFSLDYLPSEERPYEMQERVITFNERKITVYSDLQDDHASYHCRNLNMENGRCGVHGRQPFSCDFELIRSMRSEKRPNQLTTRLFGRGWQLKRVDGERGALCTIMPVDIASVEDVIRKLKRLKEWCDHFSLQSCTPRIIQWAESGPHDEPGYFNTEFDCESERKRISLFVTQSPQ